MKRLYTHIKNVIESVTNKWEITFQRYAEDKPEQAGILLFSSRNDKECISGETEYECMKVEIHVTCKNEANDIFENMDLLKEVVNKFEELQSTVDGLEIEWAKHLGSKVRPSYINGYNLQVCKCVIDFNYNLD